ncbi:MAG: ketoacyl-ACP synthase III [Lachnospiraceae bacterium]|nr:ketoacyl-ACP synthase III [Lachnospiraceae bacterium]
MSIRIMGSGSAIPKRKVTNDELCGFIDSNDNWIKERTGIISRYISMGETVRTLACKAAKKAIKDAGINACDIELIIVATCSAEQALPCIACEVQKSIGAEGAVAFDLNAACAGFLFAMNTADTYISGGIYKNALIIGAEVLSNIVDWSDRSTCILFGDGAGALYFEKDNSKLRFIQKSNGFKGEALSCYQRDSKSAFYEGDILYKYVKMDGREVFRFATRVVSDTILRLLDEEGMTVDDIDMFLLHQANLRIIECIAKRLKADISKFETNVERFGNTSSASIPILIDEVRRKGKLTEGMKIVISGFGAGLTYSACLMEL